MENPNIPLDRACRVLLGTLLERLEQVSRRIAARITSIFGESGRYFELFRNMIRVMANPSIPLDRAHRVALTTRSERLEQVSRRIAARITQIGC